MKTRFLIALLCVLLLLSACSAEKNQETTTAPVETIQAGTTEPADSGAMPDFTVYDQDGNPAKLSDFRGKPVILNFWSSNCGPCKREMPDFEKAYQKYGQQIHFLMVNVTDGYWDTLESATGFMADAGYTFPVFYDTDLYASQVYGISALPTTFFVDAQGNGIAYAQSMLDTETLQKGIDMILPQ